jgi:lipopolysaccharide transport system permease protein
MAQHPVSLIWLHFGQLLRVTRSELRARYAGSLLGLGWVIIYPVALLSIYSVVYLFILRVKPAEMESTQYVLYIFAGLVPFLTISESLAAGVGSVVANKAVLANTVFPIELVPVKMVLLSQGSLVIGLIVTTVGAILLQGFSLTLFVAPILWILLMFFITGLLWILAVINIIFRDLQYLINLLVSILMFASPIAYTPSMVPEGLKVLIILNPFTYFITAFQKVLVLHTLPNLLEVLVLLILSFGTLWLGGLFFSRVIASMIDYV